MNRNTQNKKDIVNYYNTRRRILTRIFIGVITSIIGLAIYIILDKPYIFGGLSLISPFGLFISVFGLIFTSFYIFQNFLEGGYLTQPYAYHDRNITFMKSMENTKINNTGKDNNGNVVESPLYVEIAERMEDRLIEEIKAQGRKANTNLFMGVVTAFISVSILGLLSFQATANFDLLKLISKINIPSAHESLEIYIYYAGIFISKIALSITASIFSFFFLSTYRRNLSEIKFFQNELTNVEYRLVSLFMARDLSKDSTLNAILLRNAEIERNFILKRGESTLELRSREIDVGETEALMTVATQAASEAISAFKAGENKVEKRKNDE